MSPTFSLVTPGGSRASIQAYCKQGGVILCVWSVCRLIQWWLVFILLGLMLLWVMGA